MCSTSSATIINASPPMSARAKPSSSGAWFMLVGIAVLTVVALGGVMRLRFSSGEIYPEYSTNRVDPLGTRALHEALGRLKGVAVERHFQSLDKLQGAPGSTLILSGLDTRQFNSYLAYDAEAVGRFAGDGGRVVIALNPAVSMDMVDRAYRDAEEEKAKEFNGDDEKAPKPTPQEEPKKAESKPKKDAKSKAKPKDEDEFRKTRELSFAEVLKISAKAKEFFYSGEGSALTLKPELPLKSEQVPLWMSNVYLDDDQAQLWRAGWKLLSGISNAKPDTKTTEAKVELPPTPWKVLATKGDRIMIAERKLGMGTVVVCTDRYFLSNEALWKHPTPRFLTWLVGDAKRVIFEETHLGSFIGDTDGIMTLARRYRMHGLFLGCILLFALFIWRNAISLVPSNPNEDLGLWRAHGVAGQSSASGLEGLLRRGIPTKGLLKRCFDTWLSTRASSGAVPADRRAKAQALVAEPVAAKQAATTYQAIRDALHPRR